MDMENTIEQVANAPSVNAKVDALDKVEQIMLEELEFYSNKDNTYLEKTKRLNITDRMVKSANAILSVENLKERRYMNRTERKAENRRISENNK